MEVKANYAAARTGNVALEIDILDRSRAHYFLIAFPVADGGWAGYILTREDIHHLLKDTTLTWGGRVLKYKRVQAGQYRQLNALIPVKEIVRVGQSVLNFIALELEQVEFWKEAA